MATKRIVTLTLNPSVDIASDADAVRPVRKVRTRDETFDPGGGGVNVSRVLRELGADTLAVVVAGGVSGRLLEELLGEAGLPHESVRTAGRTRVSYTVHDLGAKQEYRFVPEGPVLAEHEWRAALKTALEHPYVVQERIVLPTEPFPSWVDGRLEVYDRMVDIAPFVSHAAHVDGALTRIATNPLLNVTAGGGSSVAAMLVEAR